MEDVTVRLQEFSRKISIGALGGGGLIFTLITCYSLYSYVEKIFNDIWRVGQRRTVIGKFLTFYAMVTLLPTLAGFSLYWSSRLAGAGVGAALLRAAADAVRGAGADEQAPAAHQRQLGRGHPGRGGDRLPARGHQVRFVTYAHNVMMKSYSGVYGPIGLVPLVLVWIYTYWVLVLLGAEIAHSLQNLQLAGGRGPAAARRRADQRAASPRRCWRPWRARTRRPAAGCPRSAW